MNLPRGKTLDPFAVDKANQWRIARLKELEKQNILVLTRKERHELHNLRAWAKKHQVEEVTNETISNKSST